MLPVFLQGLSLGLAFLAPIGMQNLFVINSALSHTFTRALATSLVVVFWDISLGVTCFLGAGALMDAFPWLKKIMLGLGGLLVIYIGIGLIRTESSLDGGEDVNQPFLKIIVAAFVVTWLNPQALIDGTMMLGAFRATLPAGGDLPFIFGFTSASFIWFNGLAIASNLLGAKINTRALTWLNRLCGVVIICYGAKLLFDLARMIFG